MKRQIAGLVCGLLFGAALGCGSKGAPAGGAGAGSAASAVAAPVPFDFKALPLAAPMGPKARALFAEVAAAGESVAQKDLPRIAAALIAWSASGEAMSISDDSEDAGKVLSSLAGLRELNSSLTRSDDPLASALLSLAHGLRSPSNAPLAIFIGCNLAFHVADHLLGAKQQPVTEAFRIHAISEADALAFGRAGLASGLQMARLISLEELQKEEAARAAAGDGSGAPARQAAEAGAPSSAEEVLRERKARGMPVTGDWLSSEFEGYAAFWDETEALAAKIHEPMALARFLEERRLAALAHPTSMLVRLVAEMTFSQKGKDLVSAAAESARKYQRLIGPK